MESDIDLKTCVLMFSGAVTLGAINAGIAPNTLATIPMYVGFCSSYGFLSKHGVIAGAALCGSAVIEATYNLKYRAA